MNAKRLLSLFLVIAMCLTVLVGCSNNDKTTADKGVETDIGIISEELNVEYGKVDTEYYQELIGANPTDTILTTSTGDKIDVATFSYWLAYYMTYFESSMGMEVDWSTPWSDELLISDVMKEYAGSSCVYYSVIQTIADKYGVELSQRDYELCKQNRIDNIKDLGHEVWNQAVADGYVTESKYSDSEKETWIWDRGREVYADQIKGIGTTDAAYNNILLITRLYEVVMDKLYAKGGEFAPTQEELDQYIADNHIVPVRFIYLSSYDESYNSVDQTEKAQGLIDEIKKADDKSAKFLELMESDSEADFDTYPNGYLASDSDFEISIMEKLEALGENEVCLEVLSDDYGWYIFMRTAMDEEQLMTKYIDYSSDEILNKYLENIELNTTEMYDNLDIDAYYEKIKSYSSFTVVVDPEAENGGSEIINSEESNETTEQPSESTETEDETESKPSDEQVEGTENTESTEGVDESLDDASVIIDSDERIDPGYTYQPETQN